MKVKNIMFFGFAAAILSAGAASAYDKVPVPTGDALATAKQTVTSKYYVDTAANSLKDDINNAGSPVKSVTQNGTAVTPDSNGNVAIVAPNWNAASGTAGYIDNKPNLGTAAYADLSEAEITDVASFSQLQNGDALLTEGQYYDGAMVMQTEVSNKQSKSGADYQMGNASGGWTTMSQNQQDALNSGITAAKVSTYDGYATTIASKQTAALEAQGTSETSTVSSSDTSYPSSKNVQSYVAEQIAANNASTGVANKQDKSGADYQMGNSSGGWTTMTQNQQDALNSGANATNIAQIATNTTAIAGKQATATADYAVGNTNGTWTSIAKPDTCTSTNPCAWVNNAWVPMAI